jgi:hypothetical protein
MAHVKDHNPLAMQKIVSLVFEKEMAHWGVVSETQTLKTRTFPLLYRRDVTEMLPKWR